MSSYYRTNFYENLVKLMSSDTRLKVGNRSFKITNVATKGGNTLVGILQIPRTFLQLLYSYLIGSYGKHFKSAEDVGNGLCRIVILGLNDPNKAFNIRKITIPAVICLSSYSNSIGKPSRMSLASVV